MCGTGTIVSRRDCKGYILNGISLFLNKNSLKNEDFQLSSSKVPIREPKRRKTSRDTQEGSESTRAHTRTYTRWYIFLYIKKKVYFRLRIIFLMIILTGSWDHSSHYGRKRFFFLSSFFFLSLSLSRFNISPAPHSLPVLEQRVTH